ncbi:hypothetical protein LDENG_00217510 [Lucifuga dentata]|nr:hypothetical protein LDENG_00217510 [Lucifuga dentata]
MIKCMRGVCGSFKGQKGAEPQLQPLITSQEKENTPAGSLSSVSYRMAYRGSVRPFVHFNAKHDAELLHKAMKGIG